MCEMGLHESVRDTSSQGSSLLDLEGAMKDLLVRLAKAVYRYERELDGLRREQGIEIGHSALVERIARKFGKTREEKLYIMETLANYRGDD